MVAAQRLQFHISSSDSGRRLDEFLASRLGGLSRMRIAALLEKDACLVNQNATPAGYHIATGDLVELSFDDTTPTSMSPEAIPLEILHEDEHLIVVVKPAGMLVHPTRAVKAGTLANALAYHLNEDRIANRGFRIDSGSEPRVDFEQSELDAGTIIRPGLVHRLDRATSGLMVVAKTQRALSVLSRHFHRRLVEKRYVALVRGNPQYESREIVAPIGRDEESRPRWWVRDNGKAARTRIEVRVRFGAVTLLELEPATGRTNQLRIHCAYEGHPIVGDELYGDGELIGDEISPAPGTSYRLCLHASRLAFHHPVGGTWMEFRSPQPSDWPCEWPIDDSRAKAITFSR